MAAALDLDWLDTLPEKSRQAILAEAKILLSRNKLATMYPDTGPYRRELYPKHIEFFSLGAEIRERLFLGGNRTGKTVLGGTETAYHLTGKYPHWWQGRRFDEPVRWWAAGDTRQTTRDIQQLELLGPVNDLGTGLIPADDIIKLRPMSGVPDAYETVTVRHVSGGVSHLGFKSFDQGRKAFQGTAKHGIWLDEECPIEVYVECLMRTMTTNGLIILTFTPLSGLTELVLEFLPGGRVD